MERHTAHVPVEAQLRSRSGKSLHILRLGPFSTLAETATPASERAIGRRFRIGMRRADDGKMATDEHDSAMTDQDLDHPATRRDLRTLEVATRRGLRALETVLRDDMRALEARLEAKLEAKLDAKLDAINERTAELRRHFDVTAENFRTEFMNLFDWTNSKTSSLGTRLDRVETSHETRLTSVELRVTRLERRRKTH